MTSGLRPAFPYLSALASRFTLHQFAVQHLLCPLFVFRLLSPVTDSDKLIKAHETKKSGLATSLPRSVRRMPLTTLNSLPGSKKNRRKNSPVAMSPPRSAGSLHTSEAPNEGDESSMAPGINFKKPPKRQPRLQANSKGLMTSWQQERTPKGGPDLGSISGTGTNGLDSACFDNDASKASIYCTNCARVPRNILGRVSRPIFGKEPLAQIFIRHDCRNFWLLDPAELLEQSGRQTLLLTQNTRALKGMAPLLQRHGFNDTCNNFRPHQNGKPPARCPRLFLSPSLLHKAFEPCKIVCVAWLKRRRHSRWHIDQPQSQAMSKSE